MSDATTASSFAFAELPMTPLPMTKSQVVEQIRTFNVSAPREWLESFDFSALQGYLARARGLLCDAEQIVIVGIRKIKPLPDRIQPSRAADARCPVRCPAPDLTESAASSQ